MRRGAAATDLMEQVGDALAAPRVASVAGAKSMWWSPEKGVRTKKAGQSAQGCETGSAIVPYPAMAVLWNTRAPRAWTECDNTLWSKMLSTHGVGEACAKHLEK